MNDITISTEEYNKLTEKAVRFDILKGYWLTNYKYADDTTKSVLGLDEKREDKEN